MGNFIVVGTKEAHNSRLILGQAQVIVASEVIHPFHDQSASETIILRPSQIYFNAENNGIPETYLLHINQFGPVPPM